MTYKIVITPEMERLLDKNLQYLINKLKSKQAAKHLLDNIKYIYSKLEKNPMIFRESHDKNLAKIGYREAIIPDMNYIIIYRILNSTVFVLGIFHCLEDYNNKLI